MADKATEELQKRQWLVVADGFGEHAHEDAMGHHRDLLSRQGLEHEPRVPHPLAHMRQVFRTFLVPQKIHAIAIQIEKVSERNR